MTAAEVEAINTDASVLMKRGIALLEEPRREAAIDALYCFDEALALRRRVPAANSPFQGYLLAACLLNRADALVRFNDAGPLAAALASYEEGIDVLRALPLGEDSRYPRRLAMAYQNLGLALHIRGGEGDSVAAAAAFADAIAQLDEEHSAAITDRDYLRAVVWLNLANLRAEAQAPDAQVEARDAASRALAYVHEAEREDVQAAAAGLQARHVLCRLCATLLSEAAEDPGMHADVHRATDAVDEGLALVRHWELRGVEVFRAFAFDLFRFGTRVYARYQPQFLHEFIAENMDPEQSSQGYVNSSDMQLAAHEGAAFIAPGED